MIGSLPSSAHTYRLLIFKERACEKTVFLSSAALPAAEKRDYEHCFAARQQLFYKLRCDCGVHLPPPSAPRCRQRERGVILGTSRAKRKGFREINSKAPVRCRAPGLLR
ncbi:hypothetical protein [Burkholderia ubonensis]|uniref:hypothetical protein n=1 Tax=Burkholderia ubonensis TaxID=101571 RepID=UPI0012FBB6B7|nr:hypothetical protein [Burkholderia ubonensis]